MPTDTVHLTERDVATIQRYVEQGRFQSASDVVSAGLQLLEACDRDEASKLEQLRVAAQKGIDDLEAGRYTEVDSREELDEYLASIRERGMARLKESGIDAKALEAQ